MTPNDLIKKFIFDGLLLQDSFERLEKEGISVRGGKDIIPIDRIEESDFSPRIMHDANKMSSVYVVFYCLENSVRELITARLSERHGIDWWNACVPQKIKDSVNMLTS
jgi:hypothetical protein